MDADLKFRRSMGKIIGMSALGFVMIVVFVAQVTLDSRSFDGFILITGLALVVMVAIVVGLSNKPVVTISKVTITLHKGNVRQVNIHAVRSVKMWEGGVTFFMHANQPPLAIDFKDIRADDRSAFANAIEQLFEPNEAVEYEDRRGILV